MDSVPRFKDRITAGQRLATPLRSYASDPSVVVLALPRGGVPVAYEVARVLKAPLDILSVRKLGVPGHEELAMGAIASGGKPLLREDIVSTSWLQPEDVDAVINRERAELLRRETLYRAGLPPLNITGKTVILVDDGLATGSTMVVAIRAAKALAANKVIVAVPVAPASTLLSLETECDDIVCLKIPEPFISVGLWYEHFPQTSDRVVIELLREGREALLH